MSPDRPRRPASPAIKGARVPWPPRRGRSISANSTSQPVANERASEQARQLALHCSRHPLPLPTIANQPGGAGGCGPCPPAAASSLARGIFGVLAPPPVAPARPITLLHPRRRRFRIPGPRRPQILPGCRGSIGTQQKQLEPTAATPKSAASFGG
ncbi:hypothetical protein PVAP13_5KG462700 [Panicum virgatum]|uniref:Uncharacterized protein n=1 Tax=Panicum virgatum TaxID=38727 RepID=A0A8T0SQ32_PANVG|nr:hypothetical protein PVAP13_5KG462700 [Panicum virgatum]